MKRRDFLKVGGAVTAAVGVGNVAIAEVKDDGFKWVHLEYAEEGEPQYYGGYDIFGPENVDDIVWNTPLLERIKDGKA